MNKQFGKAVLKLRPELRITGSCFYVAPVEHILCGFAYEKGSGGAYLWRYAFPLYDPAERMHFAFGERLPPPQGFIEEGRAPRDEAEEFVHRIESYEAATYAWRDLDGFLPLVESMHTTNLWVRAVKPLTLILLDRSKDGVKELNAVLATPDLDEYPPSLHDKLTRLRAAMLKGDQCGQALLFEWEEAARKKLGLELRLVS